MAGSSIPVSDPIWFESERKMSLGLMMPIGEKSHFGTTPRFADIVEMGEAARDAGFEALWFADHFQFASEDSDEVRGVWEAFTMMAAAAAEMPFIEVGVLVACTGFRNPALIAKMSESIDEISGGRFILGLGAGWHEPEYDAYGLPFDHRVSRFEEAIEIIHSMLRDGSATVDGTYYQADNAIIAPRGPRPTGAPILVGSSGDRMLKSVVKYADAWNTVWHNDPAKVADLMQKVDAACEDAGRDPATLIRTAGGNFRMDGYLDRRPGPIEGDARAMANRLSEFRDLGLSHFVCGLDACNADTIMSFGEVIQAYDAM